jgi:hypothetical protein
LALAGCGRDSGGATLPSSGLAFRALEDDQRTAVGQRCRDEAAASAHGLAARELRAIDPVALRDQLDVAYSVIAEQRRPVAAVCRESIPFVTPGLRVGFDGAKDRGDGTFTIETSSDKRLTISGRVTPPPSSGRVVAWRELAPSARRGARVAVDGRFRLPAFRLRRIADNTFTVAIKAPPHAPRQVLFSAICLDCLAGAPPPTRR